MPIKDFEGETFLAYIDISGFKALMKDEKKAIKALENFYKYGYNALSKFFRAQSASDLSLEGFFISDCGILFVRDNFNKMKSFKSILRAVREINRNMLRHNVILKTSIAFGQFKYHQKLEFIGIEKNLIYGNAYLSAYLDLEKTLPKIQPGECRIVKRNFPLIEELLKPKENEILCLLREKNNDNQHLYFYWMVNHPSKIQDFEDIYSETYNLRYQGILEVLKKFK